MQGKRAAMELGINSIVILILAAVFLLGAILFIVNSLNKPVPQGSSFPFRASINDPIVFAADNLEVKQGTDVEFKLRVFNQDFNEEDAIALSLESCQSEMGYAEGITMVASPQRIQAKKDATYSTKVAADAAVEPGT